MPRILLLLPLFLVYSAQVAAAALPRTPSTPANWAQTLERIASGVVTIQIDSTRAFDTEWNTSAQATGFVIDAKRGLILTNRHVVTPGPVTAQATFQNREEVQLYPVYRDPVHDFEVIRGELAAFSEKLVAKPMIVVGTKLDATTDRARLEKLRDFCAARGLEFHAISAASGEGIPQLVRAMADALDRLAPQGAVDDAADLAEAGKNDSLASTPQTTAPRTERR